MTVCFDKWDKVFKIGPSKICGRQPLKNLKGSGLLKVRYSILCTIGSKFEYWWVLRFFTIFEEKMFNTSTGFILVLTSSPFLVKFILFPLIDLSESKGFTTF